MTPFFESDYQNQEAVFLLEGEGETTYGEFLRLSKNFAEGLVRDVGVISLPNSKEALVAYFGFLAAGVVPLFVDPEGAHLAAIVGKYRPRYIAAVDRPEHHVVAIRSLGKVTLWEVLEPDSKELHPDLAVLQLTSGSTGSPRAVRLSWKNIESVTMSIGRYMNFGSERRVVANLPFHYIYGLSLIHLAFAHGASLYITRTPFFQRKFWGELAALNVTDFSGVPFHYETIARTGIPRPALNSLKVATQAGGPLSPTLVAHFADYFFSSDTEFLVMYGQAEASPRMSFLRTGMHEGKESSVGRPIDIGSFTIDYQSGEVIYRGPNVCLGYAGGVADLVRGDDFGGKLRTGDVGVLDPEGFLFLTGRVKRFIKIHGSSVSLDQVEQRVKEISPEVVVIGSDNNLVIVGERPLNLSPEQVGELFPTVRLDAIRVCEVDKIPRMESGKVDYRTLGDKWLK